MIGKKCSICTKDQSLTEFFKDVSKLDGLRKSCKTCTLTSSKGYYLKNKTAIRKQSAEYRARTQD